MSYLPHANKRDCAGTLDMSRALENIREACLGRMASFQSVVVTGLSGIVPAAVFCHIYHKDLVVIRKSGEDYHGQSIEGPMDWQQTKYIIVDDFMSSGDTMKRVLDRLSLEDMDHHEPVFIVLYADKYFHTSMTLYYPETIQRLIEAGPHCYTLGEAKLCVSM